MEQCRSVRCLHLVCGRPILQFRLQALGDVLHDVLDRAHLIARSVAALIDGGAQRIRPFRCLKRPTGVLPILAETVGGRSK